MKAVWWSEQGTRSECNEDACLALPLEHLFAVADGVGGGPAGEMASRTTVDWLFDRFTSQPITRQSIQRAIVEANRKVYDLSRQLKLPGMACTLTLAWIDQQTLTCFNIGDSRIYRWRDGDLAQVTNDHIASVLRTGADGQLKEKNVVTRAIGPKADVEPELSQWDWSEQDQLLLCSDGISDPLSSTDINAVLSNGDLSMADKVRNLAKLSAEQGGSDDKTSVLAFCA